MNNLAINYLPIGDLKPNPRNCRTHPKKQLHQIAASIREFGFNNPVLIDSRGVILAGHGRVAAAKIAGLTQLPVLQIEHLSDEQKRVFALADNKIALNAGWDLDMLALDLKELSELDLHFDLEISGFSTAELDVILDAGSQQKPDSADDIPETPSVAVSERGDLWILGNHRLLCADARNPASYATLMQEDKARVVFADPPYNVPIAGHVGGLGAIQHREFAMASGEMSSSEFEQFLREIFSNAADVSLSGAIHFICMDWRHIGEILRAGNGIYSDLKNVCVWNKNNGGMGSFYRSKHELVFVYKVGNDPHLNTVELGSGGRYRTNVWDYAGVNTWRSGRDEELAMHPTVKPTALVIDAIKDCSRRGDIVLDPTSGSGTTIMAAEKSKRCARAIELDPAYVDVSVKRWEAYTGKLAVLAETGETFADVDRRRGNPFE